MTRPARFSFVDEGEVVRRLNIDRATLLAWVEAGRLRSYPGVGKGNFFRLSDVEKLAAEIAPPATDAEAAEAEGEVSAAAKRQHDPAYKVHLRLQADLRWLDLAEDDLHAWIRELHPAAYEKNRSNITRVRAKLDQLVTLMDEAAEQWKQQGRES